MTREDLSRLVDAAPDAELPGLAGDLEMAKAKVYARLATPKATTTSSDNDENLSIVAAAKRLGVSRAWLYKRAKSLPFTLRIGSRLLFSSRGLEKWNRQRIQRG